MTEPGDFIAPPPDPRLARFHHYIDEQRVAIVERKLNTCVVEYLEGPKHEQREEVAIPLIETRT